MKLDGYPILQYRLTIAKMCADMLAGMNADFPFPGFKIAKNTTLLLYLVFSVNAVTDTLGCYPGSFSNCCPWLGSNE